MIYITGDKHGRFSDVLDFCHQYNTSKKDIMIVLGDAGINYCRNENDYILKEDLKKYPITFFCIHGNHEERPENISTYITKKFKGGIVYYEKNYPNILFAKDAQIYDLNNFKTLVIGGAYSIDKYFRLIYGYNWYESEQPSEETKEEVRNVLKDNKIDIILSHTCPYKYIPSEMFISGVNQENVDNSTEYFLDEIEEKTDYKYWYCGHYHTNKEIDKMRFMYGDIKQFPKNKQLIKKYRL